MSAVVLWSLLLLPADLSALPPDELARRGEEEFAAGVRLRQAADQARPHFQSAAECFEELHRRGARNALLYRNLGNAYFLAGDLPRAILAYRRGLRLSSGDEVLRANLASARERVAHEEGGLGRPLPDTRPPWLPRPDERTLFLTAGALYLAAWALLARWLVRRRRRPLVLGLLCLLAGCVSAGWLVMRRDEPGGPLVVIAEDGVLLRKGNGLAYPPRSQAPLNRGVEAVLRYQMGDWLQIELPGGETGWVPRGYALVDEEEG